MFVGWLAGRIGVLAPQPTIFLTTIFLTTIFLTTIFLTTIGSVPVLFTVALLLG